MKDLELATLSLSSHIAISSNTQGLSFLASRGSTGSPLKIERVTAIVSSCQKSPKQCTIPRYIQGPNPS
jgi:hypothetical protein